MFIIPIPFDVSRFHCGFKPTPRTTYDPMNYNRDQICLRVQITLNEF